MSKDIADDAPRRGDLRRADKIMGLEVLALGDGLRAVPFSVRLNADSVSVYLKVTSSVRPRALIAPGVLLLLSWRW